MNTARTFSVLLAALALVSGTPPLVVAAQEPVAATTPQKAVPAPPVVTHHPLGLEF